MKKTLYEVKKGKQMQASGSWKVSKKEDITIKVIGSLFAIHILAAIFLAFIHSPHYVLFFILTFVWMFIMMGYMFYVVYKKNKEKPMDIHYYDVDYKYNGIKGEVTDNTKEISEEEFKGRS
ncbi:MAG: hypothetical protein IKF68_07565 [Erysipelotrichaceae bacterium]|nr:hypothetical protein [Erysipelotrichaceae bacterium]